MTQRKPYLVADVGATNARFALLADPHEDVDQARQLTLATTSHQSAGALLSAALDGLAVAHLQGACIAVAGPVRGGRAEMTNSGLCLEAKSLSKQLHCSVSLVNDFVALAHGLPHVRSTRQIGGQAQARGVMAVLGPGSGLGMSALVALEPAPLVIGSEGGHADLAPGTPLEAELLGLLGRVHGGVTWETVLSGPGLMNLYHAMAELWGATPELTTPESVSEQAVGAADPLCHQTLETFFGFLGSAAGNLALTFRAEGGVYIGGGIVPPLVEFAATSPLRRRFEERGELADYVARIPLHIILDRRPGLAGAAACLRSALVHTAPGPQLL